MRAPLTGIVLVLEMTDNYQLILPMIITCLGATVVAQLLGGKPLYSSIPPARCKGRRRSWRGKRRRKQVRKIQQMR